MAYGIGSILGDIDQKADAYRTNPDALAQSYQQNQQLIDLLVLQKLKTDKEAAQRDMQAKMQTPASTIKDQREQQVMGMTRNEVAQQVTPGLQALAQQQQAAQAQGISSLPAPNMQQIGMAEGGIVNFAEGDPVRAPSPVIGYRKDGTAITMEESYDIPGADIARLREDYVRNTQGEYSRENWKAVGEGIMKFFNPPPRTAPLQPERETYLVEKPMAQVDPRLEETQNTTADLQEILSGTKTPATMRPENEDIIYGASLARRDEPSASKPKTEAVLEVPSKAMERTPSAPAPTRSISNITNADYERNIASMLGEDLNVPKVPTKGIAQAPSTPQSAYAQQLADLRTEQESKLESLIAFLKGAGGQSSFAATVMGGSDAMNAREAGVKAEIMDVLGKLETIDLKERELGFEQQRIGQTAEQLRLQGLRDTAAAENDAEQNRIAGLTQKAAQANFQAEDYARRHPTPATLTDQQERVKAHLAAARVRGDDRDDSVIIDSGRANRKKGVYRLPIATAFSPCWVCPA